jgi:hypothetical protein
VQVSGGGGRLAGPTSCRPSAQPALRLDAAGRPGVGSRQGRDGAKGTSGRCCCRPAHPLPPDAVPALDQDTMAAAPTAQASDVEMTATPDKLSPGNRQPRPQGRSSRRSTLTPALLPACRNPGRELAEKGTSTLLTGPFFRDDLYKLPVGSCELNAIAEHSIGGSRRKLLDRTPPGTKPICGESCASTRSTTISTGRTAPCTAPLKPLPEPVNLDQYRVRRRTHAGCMINEYRLVA